MATFELIEYTAVCPCEQGSLTRVLESPDSAYARPSWRDISFNCPSCSAKWSPSQTGEELFRKDRDSAAAQQTLHAEYRDKFVFPLVWR
jgi:hypothetical protein